MENLRKWFTLVLQITIVALILWFIFDRRYQDKVVKEYWENPNFKTDSIKAYVDYEKLPKPEYKHYVPPKVVVQYIDSTQRLESISVVMDDSLLTVIDSLQSEITKIHINYLKLYPDASKLIYGEFTRDSIRLDLLYTDGTLWSNTYGVNYGRFNYQYKDGDFRAESILRENSSFKTSSEFFGYTGYDVTLRAPIIGLDYSIYKNRLMLKLNSFIPIEENTTFHIQGNIGYKIR